MTIVISKVESAPVGKDEQSKTRIEWSIDGVTQDPLYAHDVDILNPITLPLVALFLGKSKSTALVSLMVSI